MDPRIPGVATLVGAGRDGFHNQVLSAPQSLLAGRIVCLGRRTIIEV